MNSNNFWRWYDSVAAPRLARRESTFRKIFQYLDRISDPITIVETGCMREVGNWGGDGQSTLLWDRYVELTGRSNCIVIAIDLDPAATSACADAVSNNVDVRTGDSVALLGELAQDLSRHRRYIDLLYMDSYDVDWSNPISSAVHHLKELVSVSTALSSRTLVVVDDSPQIAYLAQEDSGQYSITISPKISGKGLYVAEYARQVGARLEFAHYQAGWVGIVKDCVHSTLAE